MRDAVERPLDLRAVGDVAGDVRDRGDRAVVEHEPQPPRVGREVEGDDVVAPRTSSAVVHAPMHP